MGVQGGQCHCGGIDVPSGGGWSGTEVIVWVLIAVAAAALVVNIVL
jgi:hypothetical protein